MTDLWVLSLLGIPIAFLFFVLIVQKHYLERRVKRLEAKLGEANRGLEEANRRCDVSLLGFDSVECDECHLPGDCPLCGAT